jgi:hypothetical protein
MKKIVLTIAAVAALAATASAPAEAHRLHLRPGAGLAAAAAIPLVAGLATEALVPGPDYYYAPTPLYYGAAPVILPYHGFRRHWW